MPHCPNAERVARHVVPEFYEYDIVLEKIRMKTDEIKELSSRYNVMVTPTILMIDRDGNELRRIVGVPSEENLRKEIEKLPGLRKSFMSKILGGKMDNWMKKDGLEFLKKIGINNPALKDGVFRNWLKKSIFYPYYLASKSTFSSPP